MRRRIEFYRHALDGDDRKKVDEVLRSVFLTTGPVTAEFEASFAAYTGLKGVVAMNSCTAALHLALLALGIGRGDEVIVPAMTFIATATSVMHTGARPVLVDVEPRTGLIDVKAAERAVTPRTKAIMPVHLYGAMADMRELSALARRCGLALIEDCAHCVEGERDGIRPGQLSDAACYSFYATKNLSCGEGGALGTNRADVLQKLHPLKLHGMSKDAAGRYHGMYKHWDMICEGWKYNLDDIHSALLVNQLKRLDALWEKRREVWGWYDEGIGGMREVERPGIAGKSAYHMYTVLVGPGQRDKILEALQNAGIGVAVNYRAMHTLSFFREKFHYSESDFSTALDMGNRTITLPFYPSLEKDEVGYVADVLRWAVGRP